MLHNIYEKVKHQISGTAWTYASTFMEEIETNFLDTQKFKLLVWFRYIDDVFFIWAHAKGKVLKKDFNNYHPNIKFTHEFNKKHSLSGP